jgi:hypothetical protein
MAELALKDRSVSEPTLGEEVASLGDGVMEMANLSSEQTGVEGIVFISTAIGSHGPRVKYYPKRGGYDQPSFSVSIAAQPRLLANSLPDHVARRMAPVVVEWVRLNHTALRLFWNGGNNWTFSEVVQFVGGLKKLSS